MTVLATAIYAAVNAKSPLAPFSIDRREPRANDLLIDIATKLRRKSN